jgi:hypothetical protein
MVLSASIIFTLGVVHLVYTFWGPNLTPRDPALQISMSQIAPVITKETTMRSCWVGFNASHRVAITSIPPTIFLVVRSFPDLLSFSSSIFLIKSRQASSSEVIKFLGAQ